MPVKRTRPESLHFHTNQALSRPTDHSGLWGESYKGTNHRHHKGNTVQTIFLTREQYAHMIDNGTPNAYDRAKPTWSIGGVSLACKSEDDARRILVACEPAQRPAHEEHFNARIF